MKVCFHCGEQYREVWRNGKFQPLNVSDDRPHWATCKAKGANRLRTRAARRFRRRQAKPLTRQGKEITGKRYRPGCGCDVPPWDACAHSSPEGAAERINAEADMRLALELAE